MSGSTLKCPNCGAPRSGTQSCPKCGIIFAKYAAKQRRLEELEYQRIEEQETQRGNHIKLAGLAAVAFAVVGTAFAIFSGEESQGDGDVVAQVTDRTNPYNPYNPTATKKLLDDDVKNEMAAATFTITNPKLKYPRNRGTGVIVTHSCQALTSAHITYYKDSEDSSQSRRRDSASAMVDKYEALIEEKREKFVKNCKDCSLEAFDKTVTKERKRLQEAIDSYNQAMDEIAHSSSDSGNFSVRINKNTYMARADERNESVGLALLSVNGAVNCEPAVIGDSSSLGVGDKVFMIGGDGRVADGVITSFSQTSSGLKLINHDAYAGGVGEGSGTAGIPLFNAKGELLGIHINSTGAARNAIAIEDVLREFRLPL